MTSGDEAASSGRRTWLFVMSGAWGFLGLWTVSDDQVALGCSQLVLAGVTLAAALSSRVAAIADAPVLRRKRPQAR